MYVLCKFYGGVNMRLHMILPDALCVEVDELAKQIGVSRSAYIVMALKQKVQSEQVMKSMPEIQSMMAQVQQQLAKMPVQNENKPE